MPQGPHTGERSSLSRTPPPTPSLAGGRSSSDAPEGFLPNVSSYNTVISACEKGQQPPRAVKLLPDMRRYGFLPSVISYNAAISACEWDQQPCN